MTWELTPAELDLTRVKIEKINGRAVKRGFTGRLDVVAERFEKTTRNRAGLEVTEIKYRVSVAGEPPSYGGWSLLAALDWSAAGLIVRTAPGVQSIDRSRLEEGKCDHCGVNRRRKNAYVVSDGTRQVQVGSTCLKDFLGWSATVVTLWEEDLDKALSGCWGGGERAYSTDTVLAAAWAVVTTYGFVRAHEIGATRDKVATFLSPGTSRADKEFVESLRPVVARAAEMGRALRKWVQSEEFSGTSEYVLNLKTLCGDRVVDGVVQPGVAKSVEWRHLGTLVSAPQAMAKAQDMTLIKQRERTVTVDEWLGEPKQRLGIRAKVGAVRFVPTRWGSQTLYTLLTEDGRTLKWWASEATLGEEPSDEYRDLRVTVTKHGTYRGRKETTVNRCVVVDSVAAAS